jgi:hypothetical protein
LAPEEHASLKAFLSSRKEAFRDWRSPKDALDELYRIRAAIRSSYSLLSSAFVTHREAKELREMWVLAKCTVLMDIPLIKLSFEDRYDGYVKRAGEAVPAEVLEVLEPGRKRNLEFGADAPEFSMDPGENWVKRANAIPGALETGIRRKKAKSYPQFTELFIYLNIDEYGIRQKETEQSIRSLLAQPVAPFGAIHVRWKEKLFSDCGSTFVDMDVLADLDDGVDDAFWCSIIEDVEK